MASEPDRAQHLRDHLDASRQKLLNELNKGARRDKELVQSYERHVHGVETELQGILQSQTGAVTSLCKMPLFWIFFL